MLCAFIALTLCGGMYVSATPTPNPEPAPDGQMCQSREGVTAYIRIINGNKCCAYFHNSTSRTVEVNWKITGIDKTTGLRVEVASGRSSIAAGKTGNTCDSYWCGGSDYRDGSYSVTFDLCN